MKRYIYLILIVMISATLFSMPPYTLEKVRDGYQLSVTVPSPVYQEITVHDRLEDGTPVNETFTRISVPGFAHAIGNTGGPELVQSAFKLAIEDRLPQFTITGIEIEKLKLSHPLYPVQQMYSYCPYDKAPPFEYDKSQYSKRLTTTSFITLSEPYFIRGQKGVSITLSPVHYNPAIKELTIVKKLTVLFKTEPLSCVKSQGSKHFDKYIREVFRNLHKDCDRNVPSEPFRDREKYVIIFSDDFTGNADLQTFIDFRKRDYDVVASSIGDLGGNNPASFNTFLEQEKPTYALFVGWYQNFYFYQGVEPMNNNWTYTYLYYQSYGQMDPHPDFHLGLFFVRTADALKNAVKKTIHTTNTLGQMGKGYVAFTGHDMEFGPGKYHIEELFDKFENDYWKNMDIDLTKIYVARNPECDADICVTKMNEGVRFINYNGHGWEYGWVYKQEPEKVNWTTKYGLENWGPIENTVYPFVFSCACLAGNFMYEGSNGGGPECWAETWLGHERMGTACIASQAPSSFNQHALNRGILIRLHEQDMTQIGAMMDFGKEYTFDSLGTHFGALGAQEYHLFGCPASETLYDGTTETAEHTEAVSPALSLVTKTANRLVLSVPVKGNYTISIYEANGRLSTQYSTTLSPGKHTLPSLKNTAGNSVYFLSIKGGGSSLVKKLPVIR